jgi:hypothetical protein
VNYENIDGQWYELIRFRYGRPPVKYPVSANRVWKSRIGQAIILATVMGFIMCLICEEEIVGKENTLKERLRIQKQR